MKKENINPQVTAATFGFDGDGLPSVQGDPAVLAFLQVCGRLDRHRSRLSVWIFVALCWSLCQPCSLVVKQRLVEK